VLHASVIALQSTGVPDLHIPALVSQVSMPLHALPSLQSASLVQLHAFESCTQPPACSLQLSTVHALPSSHVMGVPLHIPATHLSPVVHPRPSLQVVFSAFRGSEHFPVASQIPTS
jgi:hypothetical protein